MNKNDVPNTANSRTVKQAKYKIIAPENYTSEHTAHIKHFTDSIKVTAKYTDLMLVVRDTSCCYITGTELSATKFGLKSGNDFKGRSFSDLPCKSIAECSEQLYQQNHTLMNTLDVNKTVETLNVFEFADGLKARVGINKIFLHEPSKSILGVVGIGSNVELKDFINIIPSYIMRFGAIGSIQSINQTTTIRDEVHLNDYEQEICFLFLLGWNFSQVAEFMNVYRPPNTNPRNSDTIIKKKNYICQKLKLATTNLKDLCEYLFSIGFHKKMPHSFYSHIIGTKIIN